VQRLPLWICEVYHTMTVWRPKQRKEHATDAFRVVNCEHCNRPINMTNLVDIKVFCDDGCLQDWRFEHTPDTKDSILKSIDYEQHREELEEEF
jgi:hypothetical protein